MVASRKSKRLSRKAKRSSRRVARRKHRGGATVTVYFMLAPSGAVSNVFSTDPGFTIEASANPPSAAGKVNIKGASTSKITGVDVKAIPEGSTAGWASGLMSPAVSNLNKFVLSKGTSSLMGRSAVAIPAAGVKLTDNLNMNNLLGTANWSASKQPHSSGVAPPGGSAAANIRVTITTNP